MRTGGKINGNTQTIPADNAGRRMQHNGMTHRFALGVERLLHPQRAGVAIARQYRARAVAGEIQREMGVPA